MTANAGNVYDQPHLATPLVDRQHRVIEILRMAWPRAVTGAALSDELGVSIRSIQRDVSRLATVGIPIHRARGTAGGYRLAVANHLDPVALSPGEVAALIVAIATVGPTSSATAASALNKLVVALTHDAPTTSKPSQPSAR